MAGYSIRSVTELSRAARGYFTGAIQGTIASVWANTFTVIGKVMALLDFEHEQRRAWLYDQIFSSSAAEQWLERHGFELGLTRAPATKALGTATFPATSGTVVPAGLVLTRGDGLVYVTLATATAAGSTVTVSVEADLAGDAGNLAAGETLARDATVSLPSLAAQGAVDAATDGSGLSGGADREALESFRARVLARKRNPPRGGSASDFEAWAHEALPVVRGVYVDSFLDEQRAVWVAFTVTDQPDGIPTAGQVAIVQAYLDDPVRRPVTARVFVMAPIAEPVAVTVRDLTPDTADVRLNVAAEVAAVFLDRAHPSTPSRPFTLQSDWISEAVSRATGEDSHDLVAPADDVTFAVLHLPVLGTLTFTASV